MRDFATPNSTRYPGPKRAPRLRRFLQADPEEVPHPPGRDADGHPEFPV